MINRRDFIKSVAVTSIAPSILGGTIPRKSAGPSPKVLDLSPWLVTIHSRGVPIIQPFIMRPNPPPTAGQIELERQFKCVMKSPSPSPWWIEYSEHLPTASDLSERAGKIDYKVQNLSDWKRLPGFNVLMGGKIYQCFKTTCWVPSAEYMPFCECEVAAKEIDQGYLWTLAPTKMFS